MKRIKSLVVSLVLIAALAAPASAGIILCGVHGGEPSPSPTPTAESSYQTQGAASTETTEDAPASSEESEEADFCPFCAAAQAALSVVQSLMTIT